MKDRQEISVDFPHSMTDKQIEETIKGYMNEIIQSGSQENTVIQCYPLISLGQHELEKRQTKRITRLTTGVSITSLIVAAIALYISLQNTSSSERWEQRQIESLATLQTKMDLINSNIRELVTVTQKFHPDQPIPAPVSAQSLANAPNRQLTTPSSRRAEKPRR